MDKVRKWSDDKVIEQLRWLWENGTTRKSDHFKEELRAASASMLDIESVIFGTPRVISTEWDPKYRNYKHRISGQDLDGEPLEFVVAFDRRNSRLIFITAI